MDVSVQLVYVLGVLSGVILSFILLFAGMGIRNFIQSIVKEAKGEAK